MHATIQHTDQPTKIDKIQVVASLSLSQYITHRTHVLMLCVVVYLQACGTCARARAHVHFC